MRRASRFSARLRPLRVELGSTRSAFGRARSARGVARGPGRGGARWRRGRRQLETEADVGAGGESARSGPSLAHQRDAALITVDLKSAVVGVVSKKSLGRCQRARTWTPRRLPLSLMALPPPFIVQGNVKSHG